MKLRFLILLVVIIWNSSVVFSQNANFKAADSSQCSGTLFTLIALNSSYPSSSYSWQITNPSNVTTTYSGNDTIFVVLTAPGLYDVRLTVTNGTTATVLNLDFLQVFSKPTIGFTANGVSTPLTGCSPFLVNFNGSTSSPGSGATYSTVSFDFGDGNLTNVSNFATNQTFSHTYLNSSTANVTYKPKVNILNSSGCFDTLTLPSITVKPSPTLSSPINPNSICSGSTFNYIPTSATAGCTFTWSRAANPSIQQAAASGTYPPSFSETLTLTPPGSSNASVTYVVTTTAPAPNSCSTQQNVVVTVKALPTVLITPSTLTICSGQTGTLTASGSPSGGTFAWSNSLGSSATANVSTAGTYSVTYSNNGCAGLPSSATVTVSSPPTVSLSVSETSGTTNNDGTICSGAVATITATPSAGGGTFSWSPVTSLFTNAACTTPYVAGTSVSVVYAKPNSTITYSVSYNLGCASAPVSTVITVVNGPTNSYSASVVNACSAPVNTNFTSTSTAPSGSTITNTAWTFTGGTPNSGTGIGPISVTYSAANQSYGITLTTTASNGCSTASTYTNAITIGNGSAPSSTFSVTPSNSICVGTSLTLTYTGSGADSIRWDLGNGAVVWRAENVPLAYTYTTPGTYTVSMTPYTVVGNQLGCSGSVSTQIITVKGPRASFTTSTINCSNQFTRTFTNTTTGTTGLTTYAWSFPSGSPATANTFGPHTVTWASQGTYTVTLTASDPSTGCPPSSITATVNVNSNTGANFQAYNNNTSSRVVTTSICIGSSLYFYNETPTPQYVVQSADNIRTQWDFNTNNGVVSMPAVIPNELRGPIELNVFSSTANVTGLIYTPGQYGIGMINQDNNGCRDTIIKPNYITVHGIIPNLNIADTLCVGQAFSPVDNSTAPMSSIASRTWSWGDGTANTTGNNASPSHTYTNPGIYTVTLTITDNSGLTPTCSTVITKQVLVQKPTASFTVNRNYICNNQSVVVSNNSTGIGLTNYNWSATNATPATGTGATFGTFTFNNQGNQTISLSVTDYLGCIDDTIVPISVFDVVAFATPSTTSFSCFAGTNGNPNVVSFTNLSTNNVNNTSAVWNFGNGQSSTVWQPSVTYTAAGTYNVTLTVSSLTGCQSTTNVGTITVGGPSATIDVLNASLTGCSCYNVNVNTSTSGTTSSILYFGTTGEAGLSVSSASQTNSNSYCNTSSTPQTFTPYIFISNGSCFGPIYSTETITVNPVPNIPTITVTAPTCSSNGTATISNYVSTQTYTFSPAGPTVGAGGIISGLTAGTNYTATSGNGLCTSSVSAVFSISQQLITPITPTVTTAASTCSSAGTATVSNYIGSQTYIFNPAGPTIGAGGVINSLTAGTSYTVTTNNGSCTSAASAPFSTATPLTNPATPLINTTSATCLSNGTATISNYSGSLTYTFTPTGPTVGAGGAINNLTPGTNYSISSSNTNCTSAQSLSFNVSTQLSTPTTPTITTTAASCSAAGTATISNYVGSQTYTFTPVGPTVNVGGVITGMTAGTNYTVTAGNGSCTSTSSTPFSIAAQLTTPASPSVNTTAASCSSPGTATVSNYVASQSYTFIPAGPSVGAGGLINGITAGTTYSLTTGNGSCTSTATNFSTNPVLGAPTTPTISTTSATCGTSGTASISNYIGAQTYTFTPSGPTVGAGGVINLMTPGTNYTVTTSNGTCTSAASATFSIATQLTTPPAPIISTTAATCTNNGTATISNYAPTQTYTFNPSGPTVGAGGILANLLPSINYTVTTSNSNCTSGSSAIFNINQQLTVPVTPAISTTASTCSSAGTATITNFIASQTYAFNPVGPSVGAGGVISSLTSGLNYTVTTNNGSCSSSVSSSFSIATQLTTPQVPVISTTAPTCSANGTATISNYVSTQTYAFNPAGPSVGVGGVLSGISFGTNYTVTTNNGSCTSNSSNNFSVSGQFSAPSITGTNSLCVNLTTTLAGSGTPAASNPWTSINPFLATVNSSGVVTGISAGNATIQYTDNNGCTAQTSILINPANQISIGNDITVCSTTLSSSLSATISGLATTVSWSGGSNNFSPNQGLNTTYSFGSAPSPYYIYGQTVDPTNTCPPATDSLLVTINPVPIVNAGPDQVLCSNDTLSLSGTLGGSATSGTWTSNGNGSEEFLPNNTTLNGLFVPNQTGFFQITLTSNDPDGNGPCIAAIDNFNITIDNAPTVNAGIDFVSCSNVSVSLNATFSGGASSVTWSGLGTFTTPSNTSTSFTPTSYATSSTITVTTDDPAGPCLAASDQVIVTYSMPATANAGADQTICQGSTVTLNGSFGGSATSATWSTALGTPSGTFSNVNSMTSAWTPPSNFSGTAKLVLTTNDPAGPCGAVTDTVNIIVTPLPTIVLPVTSICSGQSLNVILPNTPNYSYTWIATNNSNTTGESLTNQNSSLINDVIQNNSNPLSDQIVTYNLTITDNITTCINSNFTFSVTVYPTPIANAVNNQVVCFGSNTSIVSLTGGPNGTQFNWINLDQPLIPNLISGFNSIPSSSVVPGATADTAHIQITPSYNGCNGSPIIHNIIILPQLAVTSIANDTLCSGELFNGVIFTGNAPGMSFTWSHTNTSLADNPLDFPGGPNAGNINPFATEPNITVLTAPFIDSSTITVTPSFAGCTNGIAATFKLFVKLTPNAVVNPISQTVCAGQSTQLVDFTGNLDGVSGLVYNWSHSNTSIGIGTPGFNDIPPFTGTNNTNITQTSNFNVYPSYNGCVGDTTSFSITISPRPVINPTPDQNICGNTAISAVNFASSNGISGTTFCWTNTQPIIGLAAADCGNILSVVTPDSILPVIDAEIVVTPTFNGCDGITDTFHIIVHPVPTVNPTADQGGCAGTSTTAVTFSGSHVGSVYDWTNTNGLAIGLSGPGMNTVPSFILAGISNTTVTSTFTVTPSLTTTYNGTTLTCGGISDLFTIQAVDPIPDVYPTADLTYCAGDSLDFILFSGTFSNPTIDYEWDNNNIGTGIPTSGVDSIVPIQLTTGTSQIVVTPTDGFCSGTPDTFNILVKPLPDLFLSQLYDTVCHGQLTDLISFTSSMPGTTFTWFGDNYNGLNPNSGSGAVLNPYIGDNPFPSASPVTDSIIVTAQNNGCSGDSDTLTITVNPSTQVTTSFTSYSFCSGQTISIPINPSVSGTSVSWTSSNTLQTGVDDGSGLVLNDVAANTSASNQTTTITVTPIFNGCPGPVYQFTITVKPIPTVLPSQDYMYCSNDSTVLVDFDGLFEDSTNFIWSNDEVSIGNPNLPISDTGDILPFETSNISGVAATLVIDTFIVVPELNGCFGIADTFTITVNPVTTVNVNDFTICSQDSVNEVCFTGLIQGVVYNWEFGNTGIGMPSFSGVDCIPAWLANTGSDPGNANVVVTPVLNGCQGISDTLNITVAPIPVITPTAGDAFCHNETVNGIYFSANPNSNFTWTNIGDDIGSNLSGTDSIPSFNAENTLSPGNDLCGIFAIVPVYTMNGLSCSGLADTFTICVHPLPAVQANPDTTLCINQCFVPLASGTASFYEWDNLANQGLPYCPTQTIQLTVTGTDTNFCQNSDSMIVTYLQETPPVVNAGLDDSLCFGESYSLCATADLPNVIFLWDPNSVVNCTPFTPQATNTYIVAGYSVNGCVERDTVTLVVHPLPNVTITTQDSILCYGETAILTGNGAVNYQWMNGPSTQIYTFVPTETDDYTVIGFDQFGCTDTADITVVVNPLPVPLFSTDMTYGGCLPFCPTLTDQTGVNGNGPASASVIWEFSNGTISTEMGTTNPCFDSFGCYDVTLISTTAEGCTDTLVQQDYLCVNQIIASFTPDVTEQLIGDPCFEFTNNSVNATSFQWFFGDGEESDFVSTNHCYDSIGCYQVTLVAYTQDGCTDSIVQVVCVKDQLIIYVPNAFTPDGDGLNEVFLPILTAGYKPGSYELNIYNRWGERIFSTQDENEGWDGTYRGNPSQIGTYTYTIRLKDSMNNKVYTFDGRVSLIR